METIGLPLLIHGEVTDPTIDIFDREKIFISSILQPLIINVYPKLRIVLEHITTKEAVDFILNYNNTNSDNTTTNNNNNNNNTNDTNNIVATITVHHLLYNRNDIFKGGICPHMYCLPILKRDTHRQALLRAATSGNPKFFIG